jgi:hypothetical protein
MRLPEPIRKNTSERETNTKSAIAPETHIGAVLGLVKAGRFYQVDVPADAPRIDSERIRQFLEDEGVF